MKTIKKSILTSLLMVVIITVNAQNVTLPEVSPDATIKQKIGISEVTITYNSPATLGRKVFGGIIPYNAIWRAGANENTTIKFSHDAMVEGQKIAAGTYGLFMIPGKEKFEILFSKYHQSWGTVSPTVAETVLKVSVTPEKIAFQEWLGYNFTERSIKRLTATLDWATVRVPFKITFDVAKIVIDNGRAELKGQAGFGWRGRMQLAGYSLQNNTNLDEAMTWVNQSIASNKNFSNLRVKAGLLAKKGQTAEAKKIMDIATPLGTANQLNAYGYLLLNQNKAKQAINVFKMNVDKHPNHPFIWGFTDSLGEAYLKDGNKKMALKYYKLARKKAPVNQHPYLDGVIAGIK